jgi:plasmid stabilization system protein ParE
MARRAFARSMSAYVITPLAKADIFDIWAYIAEKSEPAAELVEQAIYDACAFWPKARRAATLGPTSRRARFASWH